MSVVTMRDALKHLLSEMRNKKGLISNFIQKEGWDEEANMASLANMTLLGKRNQEAQHGLEIWKDLILHELGDLKETKESFLKGFECIDLQDFEALKTNLINLPNQILVSV